jgi:glycosyltransferase involved in cell wall biosynthesis
MWPDIKKEVPEAELHIYYGWQLFHKFYKDNPERMSWMDRMNEMMKHEGITHHGRVSQPEIHKVMKDMDIWAYPTHFGEISCITAMKAQMLGCIPVVIDYAALETTVQHGIKIHGDIYDPNVFQEFKLELIELMKDKDRQDKIRKKMIPWAKKEYSWKKIAKGWSDEFKK